MNFSQRLRELRQANDTSQKKLAELIECSQSIICDYENEKSEPSLLMLAKLSKCFKVSIETRRHSCISAVYFIQGGITQWKK